MGLDNASVVAVEDWINNVTKVKAFEDKANGEVLDFFTSLKDGVRLCSLLAKVKGKAVIFNRNPRGIDFMEKENIDNFTKGCKDIVDESDIPKTAPLYEVLCSTERDNSSDAIREQLFQLIVILSEKAKVRKLWKGPDLQLPVAGGPTSGDVDIPNEVPVQETIRPAPTQPKQEAQPIEKEAPTKPQPAPAIASTPLKRVASAKEDPAETKAILLEYRQQELERINGLVIGYRTEEEARIRRDCQKLKRDLLDKIDSERKQLYDELQSDIESKRKTLTKKMEAELENKEEELKDDYKKKLEKKISKSFEKNIQQLIEENEELKRQINSYNESIKKSVLRDVELEALKNQKQTLEIQIAYQQEDAREAQTRVDYLQKRLDRALQMSREQGYDDVESPSEQVVEIALQPEVEVMQEGNLVESNSVSLHDLLEDHEDSDSEEEDPAFEKPVFKSVPVELNIPSIKTYEPEQMEEIVYKMPTFKKK